MTFYQNILREKEAQNWVKAALALKITKDGIQDFVEDVLTCVHHDIYNTVKSSRGLKAGATCAHCFTENVLQCPTRGICTSPRNCGFHKDLTKIYAPCPNGICGGVHDEIIQHHRYTSPSWKNTNADKWYSSPWEIGKCFLPPDGYKTVSSVRDSDFNGVISVMINCNDFQKKLSFNIGAKTNLLSEVWDIGRFVHDAHHQKIKDIELVDILFKLRTLLEDQTELVKQPKAQLVVEQLKQLQSDEFKISYDDERGMLKEGLRLRLMDHYRTSFENMPISPILAEKDAKLDRFYVAPKIVEKNHRKIGSLDKVEPSQEVAKFSDVFCHESQLCRNVFLVGEPGKGKSTFSAMCALEWTNQHSQQEKTTEHKACFADAEFFRTFDFLFHLALRDSGQSCNLTEMVQDQLISKIYNSNDAEYVYRILQTVLESEKCLIILDGLDEWNHPETVNCTCRAEGSFIPSQISANRAIVLTTTRPWRLSQFRVKDSKIDKYLEIEGANEPEEIVKNVVTILNEENEVERDSEDFMKMIRVNGLQDLLATPIITTQLVCLWFEGVSLTESKCNIYAGLINMLSCRHRCIREKVPEIELPSVFKNHECFRYNPLVYLALAKLAYTTLFSECRETSVVFSSGLVNQVLAKGQIEYALKSGLLTEKKSNSLVKRTSHFSFLHKTVQEFLSALHFCLNENDYNQLLSKYTTENKQTVLGDVSQVFVFICGMKLELAVQMSSWINSSIPQTPFHSESWFYDDNDAQYDLDNEARLEHRRLIVSGLDEARANNFGDIPLTLTHFSVISGWDVRTLNYLMDTNKNHVQSLTIFGCNDMVSEQELQNVFSFSGESLINVALGYRNGQYDLTKCHKLEYLDIDGETTTHVLVDTRNIKTCLLHLVSSDVESYLLRSFEHDRKESKLQELILGDVKNTQLLCATLPSLSHLKRIHIETTDLGELLLLPPASITRIDLHAVTMTAESVRRLVMRVENIPHTVKCCMICCTVEPASEFEQIRKYVDSSPAFKRDGTHPFQFTKM